MSFYEYKDFIEEGDLVLAFIGRNNIKPVKIEKGKVINTRYGHFEHDQMIGLKYGQQMPGSKGYGYIHLLHPTPEFWTLSLPHRTQIVYTPDSSYIMQRLNVRGGTRVIEAGTGSASFSHSFARTIGREGRLFTYEFHEPRYLEAKAELEDHNLCNTIITHRDVCNDGFEIANIPQEFQLNGKIAGDVVFLDLPAPWEAIGKLANVISTEHKVGICCFSPCIEQVDKTVRALEKEGWVDIQMVEVAGRRWEARKDMVKSLDDVAKRLKDIQARRGHGIEANKVANLQTKRSLEQIEEQDDSTDKHQKTEDGAKPVEKSKPAGFNPFGKGVRVREGDEQYQWSTVTKIETEIKTHTSYLTFANFIPAISPLT